MTEQNATEIDSLISPILPELDIVLTQMGQHPLYGDDLVRATEDTRQLIRMIISVNNHIQIVYDKEALAVSLQEIEKLGHELPRKIEILDGIITTNLLLEMCKTTKEALKMRIIPFDQNYLELCDMPGISDPSDAEEHVKQQLLENIAALQRKTRYEAAVVRPIDSLIMVNRWRELSPLYVWKYADFKSEITNLLRGKPVILNANILNAYKYSSQKRFGIENGIRFSKILLNFKFANESRQNDFYKVINRVGVDLTMIGDNYYRCDDRIYYVPTDVNSMLHYRIKSDQGMDIVDPSGLYNAVLERNKHPFLSPYNVWQMRLGSVNLQTDLNAFMGEEIDLHLIGEWHHVDNSNYGKDVCHNGDLDKNYRLDRVLGH